MKGYSRCWVESLFVMGIIFIMSGCVSFTSFNSPQTTPKGEGSIGAGTALFVDTEEEEVGVLPSAYGRVGIAERWDAGLKVAPHVFFSDLKYQIVRSGIDVSADLGLSYSGFFSASTVAAYPGVYVGTDQFYVGGRQTLLVGSFDPEEDSSLFGQETSFSGNFTTFMVGASVGGSRVRVMPEVNLHIPSGEGEAMILPALGLEYRFGGGR